MEWWRLSEMVYHFVTWTQNVGGTVLRQMLSEWCVQAGDDTLLRQWDTEKNGDLTPRDVPYGSQKKPYWRCDQGHIWQAAVYTRTAGAGCPYCAGKKIQSGSNDLVTLFPDIAREWDSEKNRMLPPPSEISPWSHRKAWWTCEKGHEWEAVIKSRTQGCGCPVCAGRAVVQGFNDLATTHPRLAEEWDAERNDALTPHDVVAGSDRRVYWKCGKGHRWRTTISSRACGGSGCPYCSGKRTSPGENDLATAFPAIADEWDAEANGGLTPDQFAPNSNRKAFWRCPLGHSYSATISSRVNRGSGCPICAGRKVLVGFNDLATKEPKAAAQWYQPLNGSLTPEMVTCGSSRKVFWRCSDGHIWPAVISSRTGKQKCGCPVCAGRTKVNFAARYQAIMEQEHSPYRRPLEKSTVSEAAK